MLQLDSIVGDLSGGTGEIRGAGWMAGPCFVANGASGRLRFEGRLLYGRSSNEISGFASQANRPARDGSFDGERWLAMAGVEGEYRLGNGAVLLPSADLGHAREISEGFRDNLGREIDGQRAALTCLRLGATLEIPVEAARGDLTLRPGLRFVATDEDGGLYEESGIGAEGRIDFGVDCRLDGNVALEFDGFYSGIGRRDRESYGACVGLRMDFWRDCGIPAFLSEGTAFTELGVGTGGGFDRRTGDIAPLPRRCLSPFRRGRTAISGAMRDICRKRYAREEIACSRWTGKIPLAASGISI